jgi:hypothetical protein
MEIRLGNSLGDWQVVKPPCGIESGRKTARKAVLRSLASVEGLWHVVAQKELTPCGEDQGMEMETGS